MRASGGVPDFESGICRGRSDEASVGGNADLRNGLGVAVKHKTRAVVRLKGFRWRCLLGVLRGS